VGKVFTKATNESVRNLKELQSLKGRVALITGGAGHLGRMFGEVVAELGGAVVLVDFNKAVLDVALEISSQFNTRCKGLVLDLGDHEAIGKLPAEIESSVGRLDILVNNAAFTGTSKLSGWAVPFSQQGLEAWTAAMDINLLVPFLLTQKAAPILAKGGVGSVVNIASIYGVAAPDFRLYEGTSMGNPAAYNASKGGLIQLTRYLATALAPSIRVNCISPGGIRRGQPSPFIQKYIEKVPLGKMGEEEDFKGIAQLLMSDLGNYITGQNFVVDGGMTVW
jgi:NAD(P)-dependent dehydrogenase (short-subunit alcohol dehydrogenase family)